MGLFISIDWPIDGSLLKSANIEKDGNERYKRGGLKFMMWTINNKCLGGSEIRGKEGINLFAPLIIISSSRFVVTPTSENS